MPTNSRCASTTDFPRKDQFFARFNLDNLTGPTTNPDQTADRSDVRRCIHRQAAQRGGYIYAHGIAAAQLGIIAQHQRSTPGFPTTNHTDPAVKFNDSLFEAFDSAAGTVMQAYGNLFQLRQNVQYTTARHAFNFGAEIRANRDSTYFGISPNGEYDFGGGTAFADEYIPSKSGMHDINPGDPLPDTLSSFLSGSPFAYTVAIAPPYFSNGNHIGPAAISRNNVNAYFQDAWKIYQPPDPRVRCPLGAIHAHQRAAHRRTAGFLDANGAQEYVVNPQPGYRTEWKGWGPRIQAAGRSPTSGRPMRAAPSPSSLRTSGRTIF